MKSLSACLPLQESELIIGKLDVTNRYLITDQPQALHPMCLNYLLSHLENGKNMGLSCLNLMQWHLWYTKYSQLQVNIDGILACDLQLQLHIMIG
jgi:hypothetical protein